VTETSRPERARRAAWLERHRRGLGLAAIAIALGLLALWL